jgi:hypothetical protein
LISGLRKTAGSSLRLLDRVATGALRETVRHLKKLGECDVMMHVLGDPRANV